MRVQVCEIYQDVIQDFFDIADEIFTELFRIYFLEHRVLLDGSDCLPEDDLDIEHDILGCVFHGFLFGKLTLIKEVECNGDHVADSLDQEHFNLF